MRSTVYAGARSCLIVFLVGGMLNLPAIAASEKPLGMVVMTQNAHLDKANAAVGTDVYSGDALDTTPSGMLRLKVGSSQLFLLPSSAATLGQEQNRVYAKLAAGMAGFSSAAADQFEIETPVATIRAAGGQRAVGQVAIAGPRKITVSATSGALVVERDGEARTVAAGESYSVTFAPDAASDSPQQGYRSNNKKRRLIFEAAIVAGAALTAYFLWREFSESCFQPCKCGGNTNAIGTNPDGDCD